MKTLFKKYGITIADQQLCITRGGSTDILCARFDVVGTAVSSNGTPIGALCARSTEDRPAQQIVIPFAQLRDGKQLAEALLPLGIVAPLESSALLAIAGYIHHLSQQEMLVVLDREGLEWVTQGKERYPAAVIGGRLIAPAAVGATIALSAPSIYAQRGSLAGWMEQGRTIFPGNPIPIAVVCAGLSAPLKALFNLPLLSLLVSAASSSGKTTLARLVNALFGPAHDPHGWSGTANGLEALALRHRDAPLVLDEMAEGKAADVLDLTYRVNNGMQKARATSNGDSQATAEIRTVIISFSEVTLAAHAKAGAQTVRQGHDARMPTIEVAEQFGCFSSLNGFRNAGALADATDQLGQSNSGVVWSAYLKKLVRQHAKGARFIDRHREDYQRIIAGSHHATLSAVEGRVLAGFASWALAGELAIRCNVLPLQRGEAVAAIQHVFGLWLQRRRASEGMPPAAVLQHLRKFFQQKTAVWFDDLTESNHPQPSHRAGYVLDHQEKHGRVFLLHPDFFKNELCKEFSVQEALKALDEAGLLIKHNGGRTWLQRMPGKRTDGEDNRQRFYAIRFAIRRKA